MEDKLDKILDNQIEMGKSLAVIEHRMENKDKRLNKVEADTESLKKFKWGLIGTGGLGLTAFIAEMYKWFGGQ